LFELHIAVRMKKRGQIRALSRSENHPMWLRFYSEVNHTKEHMTYTVVGGVCVGKVNM